MKTLEIPILERSRKYGYIYWSKNLDAKTNEFFKDVNTVSVVFDGAKLGDKKIDFKNRRISIGWRWTRDLPEKVTEFILTRNGNNVTVICR